MRPKKYIRKPDDPAPEPDALPPIPPDGPIWRVWVAKRNGANAGFFDVHAYTEQEALDKIANGEYGLGWVPLYAERLY